ncbi:MAG: hypothetical protein EZS28_041045, partial [Streblomastix strix]
MRWPDSYILRYYQTLRRNILKNRDKNGRNKKQSEFEKREKKKIIRRELELLQQEQEQQRIEAIKQLIDRLRQQEIDS